LEDLHTPFWQDVQKNLQQQGKEMELRVEFRPYFDDPSVLSEKIKIQPRKENEMKLLEEWHRNTPWYLFPTLNLDERYNRNSKKDDSEKWIRKKVKVGYSYDAPQVFLRLRNLYPCYPNLPEDWGGWKELEEKFEPSTLRDEIRWTRICYQYCATEDDKVLDELKSWLEKNESNSASCNDQLPKRR
jgi:hypothetical protein